MTAPVPLADLFTSEDWFALLNVSLTGIHLVRPVYEPAGPAIVDFAIEYLNPAGQRMTGLAEQPGGTLLGRFPHALAKGIFAYYRRVFETGEQLNYETNYQADGLDNFFRFSARRSGAHLLVSFTDTSDQRRSAVELALRESQAAERAAHAEAEQQRQRFREVLTQLPAYVAVYQGPDHIYQFVNPSYQSRFPHRSFLGRTFREGTPESVELGVVALFDQVYQTGQPVYLPELEGQFDFHGTGQLEQIFLNLVLHPLRDAQGHIDGVLDFSYDVTEQVLARQKVEQLNQELEARVQARTRELENQQRLLGQILAQVPAAITTLHGPDHRFTFANDRYQQLVEGRVAVGQTVAETLPEVVEQGFLELLDNVYRTGQTFEGKEIALLLAPPGQPPVQHYLDFTYQAMPDEHGQTQGLLVFAVDVTEQVRARRQAGALQAELLATAQRQAHEREAFHHVFEQTPALVALLRAPGHRFEYVNPAYQALFPGRQLVGLDMAEAAPETREQGFVALLDRVYQTGETYHGEDLPFATVAADGRPAHTAYFNFTYQAYRENGQIAGISIFAFDVTEQVLARQEREAQRRQLHNLFRQAPAAICILAGPDLVYELVNPTYQLFFPERELLGRPLREALPELADHAAYYTMREVFDTGETSWQEALHVPLARAADGVLEDRYFNYIQQPRYDEQGRIDGVLVFGFEVTELVQARQQVQDLNEELAAINEELMATNEELNESNTQLTRTNVDLDTFVYTASHDLKAPITNIESIVLALRDTLPEAVQQDDMVAHLLDLLNQTVARFQVTITQLTDISRLQLAHAGPAESVKLATVIESVRLDLVPALTAAGTQLLVEVAPELVVSFSPANLRSIVYNLLSNAVKYRAFDRPSQVRVQAGQTRNGVVLTVQDNGLGMSEVQQRQLFGLFQRLHTHVEGTGVGLYITKRLVENAGGTIAVHSQPDTGTSFTVTFPA
jgi:signal transduction histidine kinase